MKPLTVIVITMAALLVIVLAVAWVLQRAFVYHPDGTDPGSAASHFPNAEDITLTTDDRISLQAWLIHPEHPNGLAVLYCPGNAGNRRDRVDVAGALAERGFTVLLLDYRGFGGNPGHPSEAGLLLDARAGVEKLTGEGFDLQHVLYVGESIGTGVSTQLAVELPPAGLLLRSPFTSLPAMAKHLAYGLPVGWLVRDKFNNVQTIPGVTCPVSVLYGSKDILVPPAQSRSVSVVAPHLFEAVELPDADHNDARWFGPYLAERVEHLSKASP